MHVGGAGGTQSGMRWDEREHAIVMQEHRDAPQEDVDVAFGLLRRRVRHGVGHTMNVAPVLPQPIHGYGKRAATVLCDGIGGKRVKGQGIKECFDEAMQASRRQAPPMTYNNCCSIKVSHASM